MNSDPPPTGTGPLRRRTLLVLLPLTAATLATVPVARPARGATTARAPECLADLMVS